VGHPLWRGVGSVVCSCWVTIFETPWTWWVRFLYFPQEQGSPVIPPGRAEQSRAEQSYVTADSHSVNMSWCRAHSGLVTRHYFPYEGFCQKIAFLSMWDALSDERSVHQALKLKLKLKLIYDRRSVSQSLLLSGPHLERVTRFFFLSDYCGFFYVGAPSLTRGWVCNLIVQKSRETHDHILLSHLRLPNLEGQIPVFISPRNRVTQLYPQALGSFSSPLATCRATVEVF
jgi:hypothetical protein